METVVVGIKVFEQVPERVSKIWEGENRILPDSIGERRKVVMCVIEMAGEIEQKQKWCQPKTGNKNFKDVSAERGLVELEVKSKSDNRCDILDKIW